MLTKKSYYTVILGILLIVFVGGCATKPPATPPANQSSNVQTPTGQTKGQTPTTNQKPAPQTQVGQGSAEQGKPLFDTNCSSCHAIDTTKKVGPGLKGVYSKSKLSIGQDVNDANMANLIKVGGGSMPGNPALGDKDIANIEAYLKTLK
ncbi:MAG: cytochrome c [Bacillota bacterium]|nr:cytochrome c [Bacillota bacterium]MDP4159174.1 cytochrome c [Bacillota bacterium]